MEREYEYDQPIRRGRPRKDDLQINNVGPNQLRFKTFAYGGPTALFDGFGRINEDKQPETVKVPDHSEHELSDEQLAEAEKLADKNGISYHEALLRLGFITDKNTPKTSENLELDNDPTVNEIIEGPSVDLRTRNDFLIDALKNYCAASKHGGRAIHLENAGASESRIKSESDYRETYNRLGDDKFDIAFGVLALEKAGLDKNAIEMMTRKESIDFSKEFTGRSNKTKREDYRKHLQKQRKEFGWDEE